MAIQVTCPSCGKRYRTPDQSAGKKARCRQCGNLLLISASKTPIDPPEPSEPPLDVVTPERIALKKRPTRRWWLSCTSGVEGPYDRDQILTLFSDRLIDRTALVCVEGEEQWKPLSDLPALIPQTSETETAPSAMRPLTPPPPPSLEQTRDDEKLHIPRNLKNACIAIFVFSGIAILLGITAFISYSNVNRSIGGWAIFLSDESRKQLMLLVTLGMTSEVLGIALNVGMIVCAYFLLKGKILARTVLFWLIGSNVLRNLVIRTLLHAFTSDRDTGAGALSRTDVVFAVIVVTLMLVYVMYYLIIVYCLTRASVSRVLT